MKVKDFSKLLGVDTELGISYENCFFEKHATSNSGAAKATEMLYRGREDIFKTYLSEQGGKFDGMMRKRDYVFVFLKCDTGYLFYKCYRKVDCINIKEAKKRDLIPQDYEEREGYKLSDNSPFYEYEEVETPGKLENRLVMEFSAGQSYCVTAGKAMEYDVVEIKPKEKVDIVFSDYNSVYLTFEQLRSVLKDKDWSYYLKLQAGVYLILDEKTGKQYVGGTYSDKGIYGRWKTYAKTLTGGNKELQKILDEEGEDYIRTNFRYSILEVLPLKHNELVYKAETMWKKKLGSRVYGLNDN